MSLAEFRKTVISYYKAHKRLLPWRETITPYGVFLSEVMLQQTQVSRVLTKFPEFTARFPDFASLASATIPEVLAVWQGMGYNRRGVYLRDAARMVLERFSGSIPKAVPLVDELPGIGQATAAAIVTYTYNIPTVFIETNIRRVFIHHFFADSVEVSDTEIKTVVAAALDEGNPREWYYALMDYGAYLAKTVPNPNRRSSHYSPQPKFSGSVREARGAILRHLLRHTSSTAEELVKAIGLKRVREGLEGMVRDAIIVRKGDLYFLRDT